MVATPLKLLVKIAIASAPMVAAMYLLYWLEQSGTWVPETPHRDKITIAVVVIGMAASFAIQSFFIKASKNKPR